MCSLMCGSFFVFVAHATTALNDDKVKMSVKLNAML